MPRLVAPLPMEANGALGLPPLPIGQPGIRRQVVGVQPQPVFVAQLLVDRLPQIGREIIRTLLPMHPRILHFGDPLLG